MSNKAVHLVASSAEENKVLYTMLEDYGNLRAVCMLDSCDHVLKHSQQHHPDLACVLQTMWRTTEASITTTT